MGVSARLNTRIGWNTVCELGSLAPTPLIDRLDPLCGSDGIDGPLVSGPRRIVPQCNRQLFALPLVGSYAVDPSM